jgi:hypothetical protein
MTVQAVVTVTLDVPRAVSRSALDLFLQKLLWESDSVNSIIRLKVGFLVLYRTRPTAARPTFRKACNYVLSAFTYLYAVIFSLQFPHRGLWVMWSLLFCKQFVVYPC